MDGGRLAASRLGTAIMLSFLLQILFLINQLLCVVGGGDAAAGKRATPLC